MAVQWRPSCKTNSAKWSYDGICPDPEVFGALMGLRGPPAFKMKKLPKSELKDLKGRCEGHARCVFVSSVLVCKTLSVYRFNTLYISGDHVNVRWSDTGEFKFSGSYGTS